MVCPFDSGTPEYENWYRFRFSVQLDKLNKQLREQIIRRVYLEKINYGHVWDENRKCSCGVEEIEYHAVTRMYRWSVRESYICSRIRRI